MADALADERYIVAEAEYEDAPLFLRIRHAALKSPPCKMYPYKLAFAMPVKDPTEAQTPSLEELEELNAAEDAILGEVGSRFDGVHVLTLTTGQMREVVFYVKANKEAAKIAKIICARVPVAGLQATYVKENDWSSFKYFTESVSPS